jgi:molybdenum cofactor synthesis domain-containing protein
VKVLVLTISDRAAQGVYEDKSGPAVEASIRSAISDAEISRDIVPDEEAAVLQAFQSNLEMDIIVTTGGTGLSSRDITPDVTARFCDRTVPGIAEALRAASLEQTKHAMFSRGTAGQKGTTLIVNFPGSVRGAKFCADFLSPLLAHALDMMHDAGH